MKYTQTLAIVVAILMAISIPVASLSIPSVKAATGGGTVYLDPAAVVGPSPDVGETFVVTVKISDCTTAVGAYSIVSMTWDPAVLSFVSASAGDWFSSLPTSDPTQWLGGDVDAVNGEWYGAGAAYFGTVGATGSGDLAYVTFQVEAYSQEVPITLVSELKTPAPDFELVDHTDVGGTFECLPGSPRGPTADFTPANGAFFTDGDTINLVSTSTGGSDGLTNIPITTWAWEIDMENDGSVEYTFGGETASFPANLPGTSAVQIGITLTVTTGANPGQPTNDSTEHVVTLAPQATGLSIDIYTGTNNPILTGSWTAGEGSGDLGAVSETFGPQELVTLNAIVTYNGAPVVNKMVRFDIYNNEGVLIGTRTAASGADGVASVDFRLPWEGQTADAKLGLWSAVATVEVSQEVASDFVAFNFNYLVEIIDVETLNAGTDAAQVEFARATQMKVKITFQSNMLFATIPVQGTMVTYDIAEVPVLQYAIDTTIPAQGTNYVGNGQLIPTWAFVGQATVYANALTPAAFDSLPYCLEASTNCFITAD